MMFPYLSADSYYVGKRALNNIKKICSDKTDIYEAPFDRSQKADKSFYKNT